MAAAKAEKCARPLCSYVTTTGKYCSAQSKLWKKRRTSIVRANTRHVTAKRLNKKFILQ